ncbi:MAG TPA: hypothetical protein VJ881_00620 [Halanaerobiales bacterium]|nr:hypothetical protein [Halanaerobiales bacterium]
MEYLFLSLLGIASSYYIIKKLYGGLQGTDSPCSDCSDQECPFRDGEYDLDLKINKKNK